jgi:hypothetical protein
MCVLQGQKNGANFISCFWCGLSFVLGMCFAAKRSFSTIAESNKVPKVIDELHVENRALKGTEQLLAVAHLLWLRRREGFSTFSVKQLALNLWQVYQLQSLYTNTP